jgi:hypothetical protein
VENAGKPVPGAEAGKTATDPTGKAQVGVSSVLFYFVRGRIGSLAHARNDSARGTAKAKRATQRSENNFSRLVTLRI